MAKLPTFSSSKFTWKGGKGTATISDLGVRSFPSRGFYIRSERTGETRLFLPNSEKMVANEFYDGEAYDYFIPGENVEVQIRMGE